MKDGQTVPFSSESQARQEARTRFTVLSGKVIKERQWTRIKGGRDWSGITVVPTEVCNLLTVLPETAV